MSDPRQADFWNARLEQCQRDIEQAKLSLRWDRRILLGCVVLAALFTLLFLAGIPAVLLGHPGKAVFMFLMGGFGAGFALGNAKTFVDAINERNTRDRLRKLEAEYQAALDEFVAGGAS